MDVPLLVKINGDCSSVWLERWFVAPKVAGSSPVFHPFFLFYFMSYIFLLIAGLFEVVWVITLKYSKNSSNKFLLILSIFSMFFSTFFLKKAIENISVTICYSLWSAIGIIGVYIFDLFFLEEKFNLVTLFSILMIIFGILGLKTKFKFF